jgi:hypothetical protein
MSPQFVIEEYVVDESALCERCNFLMSPHFVRSNSGMGGGGGGRKWA